MCDVVAAVVNENNIYDTNPTSVTFTLQTPLESGCLAQPTLDRFNQYCLIPTTASFGSTCDPSNYSQSNFIFNQMQLGNIQTLAQLPLVWQSAPAVLESKLNWVSVPGGYSPLVRFETSDIPFAMSGAGQRIIALDNDNDTVYVNAQDGTFHPVTTLNQVNTTFKMLVDITRDGNLRVIGTQNEYFLWQSTTNEWSTGFVVNGILRNLMCWNDTDGNYWLAIASQPQLTHASIKVYKNTFTQDQPVLNILYTNLSTSEPFIGLGLTGDNGALLTFHATNTAARVNVWDLTTYNVLHDYQLTGFSAGSTSVPFPTIATRSSEGDTNYYFNVVFNRCGLGQFQVVQATGVCTLLNQEPDCLYISSSQNGQFQAFTIPDGGSSFFVHLINGSGTDNNITPDGMSASEPFTKNLEVDPSGTVVLLHTESTTFMCSTSETDGSNWSTVFDFYKAFAISDYGDLALSASDWNPGPGWFKGSVTRPPPPESTSLSGSNPTVFQILAWHQEYRVESEVFIGPTNGSILQAPTIRSTPTLWRANERLMIQNASETRIYNDGNIQVMSGTNVVWENNIHSNGSGAASTAYSVINKTRPMCPPSANYIAWWDTDGIFKVSYYPYNNAIFTLYGTQDTTGQRFNNSLNAQENFCFANLLIFPNNEFSLQFSDNRCACVGGQRLFDRVFTNTDLLPAFEQALLLQNLPCLMIDCTRARLNADPSNSALKANAICTVPITLCTNIIRASASSSVGNVLIDQSCGSSFTQCTQNGDCSVGEVCSGGRCLNLCVNDSMCNNNGRLDFSCNTGTGLCEPIGQGGLSTGAIIGIVVGVVVAIILIAVLSWYFTKKK